MEYKIPSNCSKVSIEQIGNTIVTTFVEDKNNGRWKPKYGETYYTVDFSNDLLYSKQQWDDLETDKIRLSYGVVYKRSVEAIEAATKMLNALK